MGSGDLLIKMGKMFQKPGESASSFAARLAAVAKECDTLSLPENVIRECFVDGLNEEIQKSIRTKIDSLTSLDETLVKSKKIEKELEQTKAAVTRRGSENNNSNNSNNRNFNNNSNNN